MNFALERHAASVDKTLPVDLHNSVVKIKLGSYLNNVDDCRLFEFWYLQSCT